MLPVVRLASPHAAESKEDLPDDTARPVPGKASKDELELLQMLSRKRVAISGLSVYIDTSAVLTRGLPRWRADEVSAARKREDLRLQQPIDRDQPLHRAVRQRERHQRIRRPAHICVGGLEWSGVLPGL